jgi:hypothetical protein
MPSYRPARTAIDDRESRLSERRTQRRPRPPEADLAALVQRQVDAQMEVLGRKLTEDIALRGQEVVNQTVTAVAKKLESRVEAVERDATQQLRELSKLQESTGVMANQIDAAANAVQRSLGAVAPPAAIAPPPATSLWGPSLLPAAPSPRSVERRSPNRKQYVCPHCKSADLRPSEREGLYEEFLRLFFIKPLRCRRCLRRYFRL